MPARPERMRAVGPGLCRAQGAATGHWVHLGLVAVLGLIGGCGLWRGRHAQRAGLPAPLENPLRVPPLDRELLWNQLVDAVDDYFRIEREERMRLVGGVLMEGRIDTFPTIGSTWLEPWRADSTPGYEKWHATLQSIRRRAAIRVIPTAGGYLVDVAVHKELEDLDKPEHATAGGATLRHDGTIVRQEGPPGRYSVTLGWIPIGRDATLEQRILADLVARLDLAGHVPVQVPPADPSASDAPGAGDAEWHPAVPGEPWPPGQGAPTPPPSWPPAGPAERSPPRTPPSPPLRRLPPAEAEPLPPPSAPVSPPRPLDEGLRRLPPPPETLPAPTAGPQLAPP